MAFLSGLLADVLEWVIGKLASWITGEVKAAQHNAEVGKEAEQSVQPLKDAKTPEQIDAATHDALDHL